MPLPVAVTEMADAGWQSGPLGAITDVPGIRVGHWTDRRAGTGCTVIRCDAGMAAAVDARGGAPGTRETDVLALPNLVRRVHAVAFCGGSALGLAAADGVARFLRERGHGFGTTGGPVPIVAAAVVFDLAVGKPAAPTADHGYRAAAAARAGRVREGSVGAGTGTSVAKLLGLEHAYKGGLGTASALGPRGIVVGALVVTNAVGNIIDPGTGAPIAAPRRADGTHVPLPEALAERTARMESMTENTTLALVATNAALEPPALQRVAYAAHDGLARTIVPCHTMADGDVAFAVSNGTLPVLPYDVLTVHALAQRAIEQAVVRSVRLASAAHDLPAASFTSD